VSRLVWIAGSSVTVVVGRRSSRSEVSEEEVAESSRVVWQVEWQCDADASGGEWSGGSGAGQRLVARDETTKRRTTKDQTAQEAEQTERNQLASECDVISVMCNPTALFGRV